MNSNAITYIKKHLLFMTVTFILLIIFSANHALAAAPVVEVTRSYKYYDNYKVVESIHGKTSSGKTVWTYKSKKHIAAELDWLSYTIHDGSVYTFEEKTMNVLNLQTGKSEKKVNLAHSVGGCAQICISNDNSIYVMGHYDNYICKYSESGKKVWRKKMPNSYYWPYEIWHDDNYLYIEFEEGGRYKIKDKCEITCDIVCINSMTDTTIKYYDVKTTYPTLKTKGKLKSMKLSKVKCLLIPSSEYGPDTPCKKVSKATMQKMVKKCTKYNGKGFYCPIYIKDGKCIKIDDIYWP